MSTFSTLSDFEWSASQVLLYEFDGKQEDVWYCRKLDAEVMVLSGIL